MVHRRPCHELCKLSAQTPTPVHVPQLGGVSRNVLKVPPRAWEGFFLGAEREKKILVYNNKLRLRVREAEEVTPDHCSAQIRFRCRGWQHILRWGVEQWREVEVSVTRVLLLLERVTTVKSAFQNKSTKYACDISLFIAERQ